MKRLITIGLSLVCGGAALAFPPAPFHEVYGTVRTSSGEPLIDDATVTLSGTDGMVAASGIDPSIGLGINYSAKVPMDAGTIAELYQGTALQPMTPFTVAVLIGGQSYVPMEVSASAPIIGQPGGRTRLDLTLGVDTDGDGMPDGWEQQLIAFVDGVDSLADVTRTSDSDGDGVSDYIEYIAGTYAFSRLTSFGLEIIEIKDGFARLRFLAAKGRTYTIGVSDSLSGHAPAAFSVNADGSDEQNVMLATNTRYQDVYISAELARRKFFVLNVE